MIPVHRILKFLSKIGEYVRNERPSSELYRTRKALEEAKKALNLIGRYSKDDDTRDYATKTLVNVETIEMDGRTFTDIDG